MTRQQLMQDMAVTLTEIMQLKQQIQDTSDEKEKRILKRKVRELQYLQLWRFELLERSSGD